jgi:hypothetical protein
VKIHSIVSVILLLLAASRIQAAEEAQRLRSIKAFYEQKNWQEVLREAEGPPEQPPDFDYYAGMAFSQLQKWKEARAAFSNAARKAPRDARFLTERAGAEYKLNDFSAAKRDLLISLHLNPSDLYVAEFLGTIYLLEGNIEAALKYWNLANMPRLAAVEAVPPPKTGEQLFHRAVLFSPPGVLEMDSYLKTNSLLGNLEVFPKWRMELSPLSSAQDDGEYKATLRVNERNSWGSSLLDGAISLLSGVPYQTVYPSFYNLRGDSINFDSLARWDSQKRRVSANLTLPLFHDPGKRLRLFFDARDENWNLSRTFSGSSVPITDLNLKRFSAGAELHWVRSGRSDLTIGIEGISRDFLNVPTGLSDSAAVFFTNSKTVDTWLAARRSLVRLPERRFTLEGGAQLRAGRSYASGLGAFASIRGEVAAHWFPQAGGDNYEFLSRLRGGDTFGDVPLDQLFQLGVERDNDLWLRGHPGTLDGRKGRPPMGRHYLLSNSEFYKTVYNGEFFRVQLGPFFDTGAVCDSSGFFGAHEWLFDTGVQARIRVLGSVSVLLSYGRDLRSGTGAFYGTSVH